MLAPWPRACRLLLLPLVVGWGVGVISTRVSTEWYQLGDRYTWISTPVHIQGDIMGNCWARVGARSKAMEQQGHVQDGTWVWSLSSIHPLSPEKAVN